MVRIFYLLFINFILLTASYGQSNYSNTALVIIDMQDLFMEAKGYHKKPINQRKVEQLLKHQIRLIEEAKLRNIPIALIEYKGVAPTTSKIIDQLRDYDYIQRFIKNTDGMLSDRNKTTSQILDYFNELKIENLIIIGANGEACVEASITGAIKEEFNVIAYCRGIASFNSTEFIYPFHYNYDFSSDIAKFYEEQNIEQIINILNLSIGIDALKIKLKENEALIDYLISLLD